MSKLEIASWYIVFVFWVIGAGGVLVNIYEASKTKKKSKKPSILIQVETCKKVGNKFDKVG